MFAMDSAQKSGFHIDDDGRVFLNGHPYKVPLELCDDGVARPTLDKKRKKILGPNGAIEPDEEETTERTSRTQRSLMRASTAPFWVSRQSC